MTLRYSDIKQGTRARQACELPLAGCRLDEATGKWQGDVAKVDIVPLLPEEIARVQSQATAYAKDKGIEPREGEVAFDIAVALFTVHAATRIAGTDQPFFDVPPESLFRAEGIGLDAFVYLFERQQAWQAESSPRPGFVTPEELQAQLERMGAGGDDITFFFARLQPAARLICLLTMAKLLVTLQTHKSGSGTAFTSDTASSADKPSSATTRKTARLASARATPRART